MSVMPGRPCAIASVDSVWRAATRSTPPWVRSSGACSMDYYRAFNASVLYGPPYAGRRTVWRCERAGLIKAASYSVWAQQANLRAPGA